MYGLEHWNKTELNRMAGEMGIPQRSKMSRGDLLAAIQERLYGPPAPRGGAVETRNRLIRDERRRSARQSAQRPQL